MRDRKNNIFNRKDTRDKRRGLRRSQTYAEKKLWQAVRNKQISGLKFFRQYGIGPYIIDFYCPKKKIAVELDGHHHFTEEGKKYDTERTAYLNAIDIKVLRYPNSEVNKKIDRIKEEIKKQAGVE